MSGSRRRELVLGVYPATRGVAYTLFDAPRSPVDWAVTRIRGPERTAQALAVVHRLVEQRHPDILVLEEYGGKSAKRRQRIARLNTMIDRYADAHAISVYRFARTDVATAFAPFGARTRHEIARVLADQIDAFSHKLPPVRKVWMDQDARMNLFNAASLVWTFYAQCDCLIPRLPETCGKTPQLSPYYEIP